MIKTRESRGIISLEKVEIIRLWSRARNREMEVIEMLIPFWAKVIRIATMTIKLI